MKNKRTALTVWLVCLVILAVIVIGCAPRQADNNGVAGQSSEDSREVTDATDEVQLAITWDMNSECAVCHTSSEAVTASPAALIRESEHATENCTFCHDDPEGLSVAHAKVTALPTDEITRLRKSVVPSESCLSCHETQEELVAVTASSTVLTDKEGTVVNPHDLPVNDDHATIACGSCHLMHKDSELVPQAQKFCFSCHHEEVYVGCPTCHGVT
jgi:hypothetical protein